MANSVSRRLILEEVKRRGWRAETIGDHAYFCNIVHPDGRSELLRGTLSSRSTATGLLISRHKHLTMDFVKSYGYRVPADTVPNSDAAALSFLDHYKKIVVKPAAGQRTEGVTVGVDTPAKLSAALKYARANSSSGEVVLQEHLDGNLYRLLVLDGKLIAASLRRAATVVGDGKTTVVDLINQANADPRRGKDASSPLKYISLEVARELLGDNGLQRVPETGVPVKVGAIDSISAGGDSTNVTAQVHDSWAQITTKLATEAGLFICGYDVMCDDISQPIIDDFIPLLETNAMPGMKLHAYPTAGGEAINVAALLLDALFPSE